MIHGFMVGGERGIMHESGTTGVDGTRKESHAERLLMRNALEGANKVGSLKILSMRLVLWLCTDSKYSLGLDVPWTHGSTDHATHLKDQVHRKD